MVTRRIFQEVARMVQADIRDQSTPGRAFGLQVASQCTRRHVQAVSIISRR